MRRVVLNCDPVSQSRTIPLLRVLRRELPWFALMAAALVGTFTISHVVIRRGVLLPSLAAGGAPGWVWAALYAPELVALLMVGWRLRSWALVLAYAGGAATVREGFHFLLRWAGEAEAHVRYSSSLTELAIAFPITIAAYAVVFLAASSTGRDESDRGGFAARPAQR